MPFIPYEQDIRPSIFGDSILYYDQLEYTVTGYLERAAGVNWG